MSLVAAKHGVYSVAIAGADRDQVVVVGEGVDSIDLTSTLRKKVGPAHLLTVGEDKKEEKKPPPPPSAAAPYYPWCPPPSQPGGYVVYEHSYGYGCQTREEGGCSIM
jgi:hypothetical protein